METTLIGLVAGLLGTTLMFGLMQAVHNPDGKAPRTSGDKRVFVR